MKIRRVLKINEYTVYSEYSWLSETLRRRIQYETVQCEIYKEPSEIKRRTAETK